MNLKFWLLMFSFIYCFSSYGQEQNNTNPSKKSPEQMAQELKDTAKHIMEQREQLGLSSNQSFEQADKGIKESITELIKLEKGASKTIVILISLIVIVIMLIGMGKTYSKAGYPGWVIIIPIYNAIISLRVARMSLWWLILILGALLIKVIGIIPHIVISIMTAKNFNKSFMFGIGLIILPFIFYPILGFGHSEYKKV